MKFGTVPERIVGEMDLSLPPDPFFNRLVLKGSPVETPGIYLGAAVWGDKSWKGKVYPPKTPIAGFRSLYPSFFNSIELNATHYRIYDAETLTQWAQPARDKDFRFCPKFPQEITHLGNLVADHRTDYFLAGIAALQPNLGPAFIQLPESFSPMRKEELYTYLKTLPHDLSFFVELRHQGWFAPPFREELFQKLYDLNIGAVITDSPGRRDAVHMHLTLPKILIRFVCNGTHPSTFTRIDNWAQRLKFWIGEGLEELYIFQHPGADEVVPDLISYWREKLLI